MTPHIMTEIHHRLKQLRVARKLKQRNLADLLDIHISTYGKIELGEIGLDIDKIQKLAKFYEITIDELIGEKEENANLNVDEPRAIYKSKKKGPLKLLIEIDPDADQSKLPGFFQKLQQLIQEENESMED